MNTFNMFQNQGEQPLLFNDKQPAKDHRRESAPQGESQWRRVLDVILVEGEMRYLVERGE
ncbi:MAG: hypothetical protein KY445_00720 [Armatimonadetes bacterium]|nr:hypothetical protein [Armatimonadota bacterium]